jgi:hypothetical protein
VLEFLKILFFAKAIALSPAAATNGDIQVVFKAAEPLVALNDGAYVSIDVSNVVPVTDVIETMRRTELAFPAGCIRAAGVRPDGSSTKLSRQSVAMSSTAAFVDLRQEGDENRKVGFTSIVISACRSIPNASVKWHNATK